MHTKNPAFCDQNYGIHSNPCYLCPNFEQCQNETQNAKLLKKRKDIRENILSHVSEERNE